MSLRAALAASAISTLQKIFSGRVTGNPSFGTLTGLSVKVADNWFSTQSDLELTTVGRLTVAF